MMQWLTRLLNNHPFANISFAVVLVMGTLSYLSLPRAQDPEINFNWIQIFTALPGASAADVEKLVTEPLEDAVAKIPDIRFALSTSREGVSAIIVRFNNISERSFDKRLNDLRREVQNKANAELPKEAEDPFIVEATTSNGFPTAMILVSGQDDDENLRRNARTVWNDLDLLKGVDQVFYSGLRDPELHVEFSAQQLLAHGVTAVDLADSIAAIFRDTSAGTVRTTDREWLVRLQGADADPGYVARLPVLRGGQDQAHITVDSVAEVKRGREKAKQIITYEGKPAVLLSVTKEARANTLDLIERVKDYITTKNKLLAPAGLRVTLLDDQTVPTREAIGVMQSNALLGLLLVLFICWVFLGSRIALLVSLGIPFSLAGAFWVLSTLGHTLNTPVLLGIVIVLGMLVDDAVVVVEAIYYRLQRGTETVRAVTESLREVFAPVTSSVLTTMAAFLPLMLLPGIIGKFMFVIPLVVTVALAVSLIEAFWMLPTHISALRVNFSKPSRVHKYRVRFNHWLRLRYGRGLVYVMRRPMRFAALMLALFVAALVIVNAGLVRTQFFAFDPMRIFYINIKMHPGVHLDETLRMTQTVEGTARRHLQTGELRSMTSIAGHLFTQTEELTGEEYGQVIVSLAPAAGAMRTVTEVMEAMRKDVEATPGAASIAFLPVAQGPPVLKPVSIKVRGDDFSELRAAADTLRGMMSKIPALKDISDDDIPGKLELNLRLDLDAVRRSGLSPATVARVVRLNVDGEVVTSIQDQGEKLELRVRAKPEQLSDITQLLAQPVALPGGGHIALGQLVAYETRPGKGNIRHYNFRRAITVEADLDKEKMDTVAVNKLIQKEWEQHQARYPNVNLDFTGELDDIQESLDSMLSLFLLGVGLIYLILGAQFRSYWQPLMILSTVPMAFTGVVLGLLVTQNPLSLYTLYGVVALTGVAVNSAIVLIDAANQRLKDGMSVLHATLYAARRRVVPILITTITTIGGLLALATGLAGHSLLWGPMASSIVWGLGFATLLTLFAIPLLYRAFMRRA